MGRYWFARLFANLYQVVGLILLVVGVGMVIYGLGNSANTDYRVPQVNWAGLATLGWGAGGAIVGGGMTAFEQTMLALLEVAEGTRQIEQANRLLQVIGDEIVMTNNRLRELIISNTSAANDLHALAESVRKKS